jgi:hypothetical protein
MEEQFIRIKLTGHEVVYTDDGTKECVFYQIETEVLLVVEVSVLLYLYIDVPAAIVAIALLVLVQCHRLSSSSNCAKAIQ